VNEIDGTGNSVDFGARMYDSRLGIFLSLDPLERRFAFKSNYSFASNTPISAIDREGTETGYVNRTCADMELKSFKANEAGKTVEEQRKDGAIGLAVVAAPFFALVEAEGLCATLYRAYSYLHGIPPEILIGASGLTASLIDPNPASDYPGGFDDLVRGLRIMVKANQAEKFIFQTNRFKFFFGQSVGTVGNVNKSLQRAEDFLKLGIGNNKIGEEKILSYASKAVEKVAETTPKLNAKTGMYETYKTIDVVEKGKVTGRITFGFAYKDAAMKTTPELMTAIAKPIK
jgi:RHS repeat-associated protein